MSNVFNKEKATKYTMNDLDLLKELVQFSLDDIPVMLSSLKESLDKKSEIDEIAELAHKIKGSAGAISGENLFSAAFELEALAKEGELDKLDDQYLLLDKAFNEFKSDPQVLSLLGSPS